MAAAAEREKVAEDANKALAQALLGDTTDTDENKPASLPEESPDSSDTDISQAEKKRAKEEEAARTRGRKGEDEPFQATEDGR